LEIPVTGGSEDFAGATGFLMMVDTPIKQPPFTVTHYQGLITLRAQPGAPRTLASRPANGHNGVPAPC
jgi:hypothetical protein